MDIAIDIETAGRSARNFLIGCAIIDRRKKPKYFYSPDEMFNYLRKVIKSNAKDGKKTYIYAHNAQFDFYSVCQNFIKDTKSIKRLSDKPLIAIIDEKGYFLDSRSFFDTKLENIGKMLGYSKLEMPKELTDQNKKWSVKEIKKLKPYVTRDTEIVYKAIKELKNVLEKLSHRPRKVLTGSQIAFSFFQHWCRKHEFDGKNIIKSDKKDKNGRTKNPPISAYLWYKGTIKNTTKYGDFLRMAYRGGRNEVFKAGNFDEVTLIDINSLYPHAMSIMRMPDLKHEKRLINPLQIFKLDHILNQIGVVHAIIETPKTENKLMYLPVRNGRQIYPHSCTIEGYYTTFEIKRAIEEGYNLIDIKEAILYKDLPFNPFKKYMQEMYSLRLKYKMENNKVFSSVIKLLMNSNYGKWGQYKTTKERIICHRADTKEHLRNGFVMTANYGEEVLLVKELEAKAPKYAHPLIAIQTTAYARDTLYNEMKKVPFEETLQCDTDSITFIGNHTPKFKIGNELGEWKIEEEKVPAEIIKEKTYKIGDKIKTAGYATDEQQFELLKKGGSISTFNMYTANIGMRTGNFDKIGTFIERPISLKPTRKRLIPYPNYIKEFRKDEMVKNK